MKQRIGQERSPGPRPVHSRSGARGRALPAGPSILRYVLHLAGWAAVSCLAILSAVVVAPATPAADAPHRVLIVYDADSTLAAAIEIARGLRIGLNEHDPTGYEIYTEFLDSARFPDAASLDRMARHIQEKYRDRRPDAVVAAGPGAFALLMGRRDEIVPGVPLYFGAVMEKSLAGRELPPDVKGIISRFDLRQTLAFARSVQPTARTAVIVTGSSPVDQAWQDSARAALGDRHDGFEVSYLSGLSLEGFADALGRLPATTAVVILSVYEDADGRQFVPRESAAVLAKASAVPTYTVYDTYIGSGVLGGYVSGFHDVGELLGTLVRRDLAGGEGGAQVAVQRTYPVADWRALERYGIGESLLPPTTEVQFRPPSLWNDYRTEILVTRWCWCSPPRSPRSSSRRTGARRPKRNSRRDGWNWPISPAPRCSANSRERSRTSSTSR